MSVHREDDLRLMLVIRGVEETIMGALKDGLVSGSTHLCIGQEAIAVGACGALGASDPVVATYRGHGWAIARGVPPSEVLAEVMGRRSALNGGRAGSAYFSGAAHHFMGENSIVGAGVPIALGLALACQRQAAGTIPLVVIGDGAMNQGNVHESLNMAAVLEIPMIVVVENNGYAEMTPSDALTAVPAAQRAAGYGIEGVEVDGNDPEAVRTVVSRARDAALTGGLPVLVEAHTHRLAGHYSGDAQMYRPAGELDAMKAHDPVVVAERLLPADAVERIRAEAAAAVADAYATARAMPTPDPEEAREHVYSR